MNKKYYGLFGLLLGLTFVFPVQVDAKPQPPCTINSFTVSPTTIIHPNTGTISWNTSNCDKVTLDGVTVTASGSQGTGFLGASKTYKLAATDARNFPQGKVVQVTAIPLSVSYPAGGEIYTDNDQIPVSSFASPSISNLKRYYFLNFVDPVTGKVTQINDIPSSYSQSIGRFRFRQIRKKYPNVKPGKNFTVSVSTSSATSAYSATGFSSSAYSTSAPSGLFTINEDPNEVYLDITNPKAGDTYTVGRMAGIPITIKWNSKNIPANAIADIRLTEYDNSGRGLGSYNLSNPAKTAILVSPGQATVILPMGIMMTPASLGGKNYVIVFRSADPVDPNGTTYTYTYSDRFTINSTTTLQSDTKSTVVKGDSVSQSDATEIIDTLVYGTVSPAVQKVQTALQKKGFMSATEIVDDVYGRKTQKAVKAYQKQNKLKVTGTVDQTLFDAIIAQ